MWKLKPTHIGLDIALKIIQELQPETPVHISKELLETINVILIKSIGLGEANIYRIANQVLTLIPFKAIFLDRILHNKIQLHLNIYVIHLNETNNHCYYIPLTTINELLSTPLNKGIYEKIIT